jgi:hypothetical protein
MKQYYLKAKATIKKYEKYLLPAMLLLGVIIDFITFRTLQVEVAFSILGVYLCIAACLILFTSYYQADKLPKQWRIVRLFHLLAPIGLQFFFGALLSASFIFYWFSGEISSSWPIIILIISLMVANEKFRSYYLKPLAQFGIFYFVLFSYLSIIFPYLFESISPWVFIFSGGVSLVMIASLLFFLSKRVESFRAQMSQIQSLVLLLFLSLTIFYFANIIPPVPLAIRDSGVYHDLQRVSGGYELERQKESVLQKLLPGREIHLEKGRVIYVFSSVYAPSGLNTRLVHHWEYYNENQGEWVTWSKPSYRISGGRQDGYRGFSLSSNLTEGKWRVSIETERGQLIGRESFRVTLTEEAVSTETVIK